MESDVAHTPEVIAPEPSEVASAPSLKRPDVTVTHVHIRRFKQFRQLDLQLKPGVSLVAGANNAGKSSLLQALAVWEFCRTATVMERGPEGILPAAVERQGLGIGDDEFSPINVPSLKHLWTNLKSAKTPADVDGYTMSIGIEWDFLDEHRELGFALSLANDRLFIKVSESDLDAMDPVPVLAYLPPFAGMTAREERVGGAIRRRRTGEGLAGAVLRNSLLDMRQNNQSRRVEIKGDRRSISDANLRKLREEDPWELLQQAMRTQFNTELQVSDFSEEYNSYIKVEVVKGEVENYKLTKYPGFNARDLMVEGSGFLQWLNVYALAVTPHIDVLLLDEPDAHLHPSLQESLLNQLRELVGSQGKQALVATHSVEILKAAPPSEIMKIRSTSSAKYLTDEHQKVGLLSGLGASFSPRFEKVNRCRRVFFYEGPSDFEVLKHSAKVLDLPWPETIAPIQTSQSHKDRALLWRAFQEEFGADITAFSLRDRDEEPEGTVGDSLKDLLYVKNEALGFRARKWRRRHIESYLLLPSLIAKTTGISEERVVDLLREQHSLAIASGYCHAEAPSAISNADSKVILEKFNTNAVEVSRNLRPEWICEDVKALLGELIDFAIGDVV